MIINTEWIRELHYIQTTGCYTTIKRHKPLTNIDECQIHYAEQKKPDTKDNILSDSIYI